MRLICIRHSISHPPKAVQAMQTSKQVNNNNNNKKNTPTKRKKEEKERMRMGKGFFLLSSSFASLFRWHFLTYQTRIVYYFLLIAFFD